MDYPIFHAILTGLSIYFCLYVVGIFIYTAFEPVSYTHLTLPTNREV